MSCHICHVTCVKNRFISCSKQLCTYVRTRAARWFVVKPKIQIWVNFPGPYVDWKMDIFYGHLVYFHDIWDIL
jgi:hypothetical protein